MKRYIYQPSGVEVTAPDNMKMPADFVEIKQEAVKKAASKPDAKKRAPKSGTTR